MSSQRFTSSRLHRLNGSHSESIYKSPQKRKEALRIIYTDAQALQNDVNIGTLRNLEELINETDTINQEGTMAEKIKDQAETLLDSKIMTISSTVMHKCSFSISKDISNYDPVEFADKTKNYLLRMSDTMTEDDLVWPLLGDKIMGFFHRTPAYSAVLGTLKLIPRREIVRQRRGGREALAAAVRPENVTTVEQNDDSVEKTVENIGKIIFHYIRRNKKPLDFFELVLHPTDFGKTIENILHVSFLIKDGHVKFVISKEGIPQLLKSSKEEVEEVKKNKHDKTEKNVQNIISLNMQQWKALVEAYQIENPMISVS